MLIRGFFWNSKLTLRYLIDKQKFAKINLRAEAKNDLLLDKNFF